MNKNEKGFSAIEALIILVIVGIVGVVGWYVWSKRTTDTTASSQKAPLSQNTAPPSSSPVFNKLPSDFTEYKNEGIGLRFGYPKSWGTLVNHDKGPNMTISLSTEQEPPAPAKGMQGKMYLFVSKEAGYSVLTKKYGATIKPLNSGNEWEVTDAPYTVGSEKAGDKYAVKTVKVSGGNVIDLSYGDEGCTTQKWVIKTKGGYVELALPSLCPTTGVGNPIPLENQKAYASLVQSVLGSITIF